MGNILHLCQLIKNVNCDEITRKLEVTKICPKSIPAKLDSFKNAEAIALIFTLIIHPKRKYMEPQLLFLYLISNTRNSVDVMFIPETSGLRDTNDQSRPKK